MKSRLILCECPACIQAGHPYKVRLSRTTLSRGNPICPVHLDPMFTPEQLVTQTSMRQRLNERPLDVVQFLATRGGIYDDTGELSALGLKAGRQAFVAGYGYLIRKSGMSLDYALEAAIEAGYLTDEAMISDLLDAIDETVNRGRPHYRAEDFLSAMEYAT